MKYRIKLTFEEDEKLLLVDRLVEVRHMVAKPPSLPPGPSFLVESAVPADLGHGHPWLKLSLSKMHSHVHKNNYLGRVETRLPVALIH